MAHNNDKTKIAVKKAKSSLERVLQMIEADRYCIDIIQQNLSVIGLLRSVNSSLLEGHVDHCIKGAAKKSGKELDEKMQELIKVINFAQSK
jgi:DNA-binding FrmR family transcriptional regulator